jgi:hypothetical protein
MEKAQTLQRQRDIVMIEKFLLESSLTINQIASFTGYTIVFINEIEDRLVKEGKLKINGKHN